MYPVSGYISKKWRVICVLSKLGVVCLNQPVDGFWQLQKNHLDRAAVWTTVDFWDSACCGLLKVEGGMDLKKSMLVLGEDKGTISKKTK